MKKTLFISGLVLSLNYSFSQTANTVPSTGNVGLGTTSPDTKLQVCGTAKIDSMLIVKDTLKAMNDLKVDGNVYLNGDLFFTNGITPSFDLSQIAVFGSNGQLRGGSALALAPLLYEADCIAKTDNNGNIVGYPAPAWKSVGGQFFGVLYTGTQCPAKVGIGTSTPVAELDVIGNIHADYTVGIGINPSPGVALNIKEMNQNSIPTTSLIRAEGATGEYLLFRNNGEMQTKANSPAYALSMENTNASGQGLYIEAGNGPSSAGNYGLINVVAGGKQVFYIDGKSSITYAREVKVNTNAVWPDYVFEDDYERMSPEEKEAYYKANKHLPGIAPATEMEDGIPVSETLNGLTRNVEENSLDINDIYKELKKLKEENERLKIEMEDLKNKLNDEK